MSLIEEAYLVSSAAIALHIKPAEQAIQGIGQRTQVEAIICRATLNGGEVAWQISWVRQGAADVERIAQVAAEQVERQAVACASGGRVVDDPGGKPGDAGIGQFHSTIGHTSRLIAEVDGRRPAAHVQVQHGSDAIEVAHTQPRDRGHRTNVSHFAISTTINGGHSSNGLYGKTICTVITGDEGATGADRIDLEIIVAITTTQDDRAGAGSIDCEDIVALYTCDGGIDRANAVHVEDIIRGATNEVLHSGVPRGQNASDCTRAATSDGVSSTEVVAKQAVIARAAGHCSSQRAGDGKEEDVIPTACHQVLHVGKPCGRGRGCHDALRERQQSCRCNTAHEEHINRTTVHAGDAVGVASVVAGDGVDACTTINVAGELSSSTEGEVIGLGATKEVAKIDEGKGVDGTCIEACDLPVGVDVGTDQVTADAGSAVATEAVDVRPVAPNGSGGVVLQIDRDSRTVGRVVELVHPACHAIDIARNAAAGQEEEGVIGGATDEVLKTGVEDDALVAATHAPQAADVRPGQVEELVEVRTIESIDATGSTREHTSHGQCRRAGEVEEKQVIPGTTSDGDSSGCLQVAGNSSSATQVVLAKVEGHQCGAKCTRCSQVDVQACSQGHQRGTSQTAEHGDAATCDDAKSLAIEGSRTDDIRNSHRATAGAADDDGACEDSGDFVVGQTQISSGAIGANVDRPASRDGTYGHGRAACVDDILDVDNLDIIGIDGNVATSAASGCQRCQIAAHAEQAWCRVVPGVQFKLTARAGGNGDRSAKGSQSAVTGIGLQHSHIATCQCNEVAARQPGTGIRIAVLVDDDVAPGKERQIRCSPYIAIIVEQVGITVREANPDIPSSLQNDGTR